MNPQNQHDFTKGVFVNPDTLEFLKGAKIIQIGWIANEHITGFGIDYELNGMNFRVVVVEFESCLEVVFHSHLHGGKRNSEEDNDKDNDRLDGLKDKQVEERLKKIFTSTNRDKSKQWEWHKKYGEISKSKEEFYENSLYNKKDLYKNDLKGY